MGGKIVYDTWGIVPKNKCSKFGETAETASAYNLIVTNGYWVSEEDKQFKQVKYDDLCVPVRFTLDKTGKDLGDDWTISSPIPELEFRSINRFWPKDWFINTDGTLKKKITVHYGPVDINVDIIDVDEKVLKGTFDDVILPSDNKIDVGIIDEMIENINEQKEDNIMFRNKDKNKENISAEETEVQMDRAPIAVEDTSVAAESASTPEVVSTPEEAATEVAEPKKKFKLGKGVKICFGIGVGVGILSGLGYFGYKFFKAKNGAPVVE